MGMLTNPKHGDTQGDNFLAYLRACHRDIFLDVDRSDAKKLQRKDWVQSKKNPESEHCLKFIDIPGLEKAFSEIVAADHKASSIKQRMLSKFIVDAFALRSVDLAIILK